MSLAPKVNPTVHRQVHRRQLPTRIAQGAGKRWCLRGENETSEAGRCRSTLFQLVRTVEVALARGVSIAKSRATVLSEQRCADRTIYRSWPCE